MKKRLLANLLAAVAIALTAISCYDDTALKSDITNLKDRVKKLEDLVSDANGSISNLWELVNALDHKIKIESVEETSDGWVITFSGNKQITVKNGISLNVSVKKDTDGKYYWTLDGDWLTDDKGEKVPASGEDAITPRLKIEGDYWFVSYDGGITWTQLDKAKGDPGAPGAPGDSLFQWVSSDASFWYFALANGDIIKVGRGVHGAKAIVAIPDYPDGSVMVSGKEFSLRFNVLPEDAAEGLVSESTHIFTLSIAYTRPDTKAKPGDETTLPITAKEGSDGKLTLTVDGSALAEEFFKGTLGASACLSIVWDDNVLTTGFFPLRIDPYGGHEWVDLGLPSGLKWATCNVGASKPEEYGDYFAWGEAEPYYEPGTAKEPVWKSGKEAGYDWKSYKWCNGGSKKITKYCSSEKADYWDGSGSPDDKAVLDPEDDAASVKWGGNWRMPTDEEWKELMNNCTWTWIKNYNGAGINGMVVTSSNGNSIFLPASGLRQGTSLNESVAYGYYWSSSLLKSLPNLSYGLYFQSSWPNNIDRWRDEGLPVRPVCD